MQGIMATAMRAGNWGNMKEKELIESFKILAD
jgi:hypothetical protein